MVLMEEGMGEWAPDWVVLHWKAHYLRDWLVLGAIPPGSIGSHDVKASEIQETKETVIQPHLGIEEAKQCRCRI